MSRQQLMHGCLRERGILHVMLFAQVQAEVGVDRNTIIEREPIGKSDPNTNSDWSRLPLAICDFPAGNGVQQRRRKSRDHQCV